jgi:sorting nexin-9/18/33
LKNFLQADEEVVGRCETVLNVTMAEMDTYHSQKVDDLKSIAMDHLDGEIAFYEQVCRFSRKTKRCSNGPLIRF